ncbi:MULTISPECIES: hypothetical protein [unclassified Shinella]|uniref:hypothetical protein n=1 Tax=unclassified Shinella TaxID=2643062 RepID=UPI000AD96C9D|nr:MULTISPECIES: hypothetical protein [unclassified Shinella]
MMHAPANRSLALSAPLAPTAAARENLEPARRLFGSPRFRLTVPWLRRSASA